MAEEKWHLIDAGEEGVKAARWPNTVHHGPADGVFFNGVVVPLSSSQPPPGDARFRFDWCSVGDHIAAGHDFCKRHECRTESRQFVPASQPLTDEERKAVSLILDKTHLVVAATGQEIEYEALESARRKLGEQS